MQKIIFSFQFSIGGTLSTFKAGRDRRQSRRRREWATNNRDQRHKWKREVGLPAEPQKTLYSAKCRCWVQANIRPNVAPCASVETKYRSRFTLKGRGPGSGPTSGDEARATPLRRRPRTPPPRSAPRSWGALVGVPCSDECPRETKKGVKENGRRKNEGGGRVGEILLGAKPCWGNRYDRRWTLF